jgi:hypothetical protein
LRITVEALWTDAEDTRECKLLVDTGVTRTVFLGAFCKVVDFSTNSQTWVGPVRSTIMGIRLIVGNLISDDAVISVLSESTVFAQDKLDGALGMDILAGIGRQSIGFVFTDDGKCEIHLKQ